MAHGRNGNPRVFCRSSAVHAVRTSFHSSKNRNRPPQLRRGNSNCCRCGCRHAYPSCTGMDRTFPLASAPRPLPRLSRRCNLSLGSWLGRGVGIFCPRLRRVQLPILRISSRHGASDPALQSRLACVLLLCLNTWQPPNLPARTTVVQKASSSAAWYWRWLHPRLVGSRSHCGRRAQHLCGWGGSSMCCSPRERGFLRISSPPERILLPIFPDSHLGP